jgi:hypothetical protein
LMVNFTEHHLTAAAVAEVVTAAPWWGVPVIAGCFLLIGASLAFLSTLASDKRKAKRDKAERIMIDTRSVGLEFLEAADVLATLVTRQQSEFRALPGTEYMVSIIDAVEGMQDKFGKLELYAHDDVLDAAKKLRLLCIALISLPGDEEATADSLKDYELAKLGLINTLRKASGVGIIESKTMDPEQKKKLDVDMAAVLDTVGDQYAQKFGTKSEE